jgi:chemosensory pili system protein ChpA (sensor histidine kinase/response regulator)
MNTPGEFDIGPLTWVKGEIELAIGRAGAALKDFAGAVANAGNTTPQDLSLLKSAQAHLHQAHGVLSIVGLAGITQFSDCIEQVLGALEKGTLTFSPQAGDVCQRALDAIRLYLDELVGGAPDQPLKLVPIYRELMALRGVAEASPADLFFPDLALRPPRREKEPAALAPAALEARLKAARLGFQRGLLKWLKGEAKGLTEMRNSVAVIEFTQSQPASRAFWWISLAFLDALINKGVPVDAGAKRFCARIDAQIAKLLEGSFSVAERLARDALYYVAISGSATDHIECVRAAYRLGDLIPSANAAAAAPFAPQLRAMRETLTASKDTWGRFSAGTAIALPQFHEQAGKLAAQGQELGQMDLARLMAAIDAVANMLRNAGATEPGEDVALEIATALLLAESALERFGQLGVDFAHQVDVMTGRLNALLRGETLTSLQAMEIPQLDEISRRAQERLLMHQVVREIHNNLGGIEQTLDGFFRDPAARANELAALGKPIKQVAGALTILGEMRAVEVLLECERQIAGFAAAGQTYDQKDFEVLAQKLSALGFFVEQLQHGPADLDSILAPAVEVAASIAEAGTEFIRPPSDAAAMAKMTRTAIDALNQQPDSATLRGEVRQQLEAIREEAGLMADRDIEKHAAAAIEAIETASPEIAVEQLEMAAGKLAPPTVAPSPEASRLAASSNETIDAELLAIFLEEAHEVLQTVGDQLQRSTSSPHDHEILTTIRRGFHTLKGSGRMVGLNELGETAWAVEQAMNQWLQQEMDATPALHDLIEKAHVLFSAWVARLDAGDISPKMATADLIALCERIRTGEETLAVAEAKPAAASEPVVPAPIAEEHIAIGELRLAPAIYDIYIKEARSHLAVLERERQLLPQAPPAQAMMRASHTLAGVSGTLGILSISGLARALEHALDRFSAASASPDEAQREILAQTVAVLDSMLSSFIRKQLPEADNDLIAAVDKLAPSAPVSEPAAPALATPTIPAAAEEAKPAPAAPTVSAQAAYQEDERRKVRVEDDLDTQLLPIFLEEGMDLLREIGNELRNWRAAPGDRAAPQQLQRLLHTLKGGARMAGAMRLGELAHSIETRIAQSIRSGTPTTVFLDEIETSFDRAMTMLEELTHAGEEEFTPTPEAEAAARPASRQAAFDAAAAIAIESSEIGSQRAHLRVRAEMVDQLVNDAGEMAIARARIEGEMRTVKSSLLDLSENIIRLRQQLREIEIQAESQMQSQMAQLQDAHQQFDPLEMDRFTRFQELTRMMAESVNDVTTVQHNLLRNLDHAAGAITAQARLNRDLSQALMSVRMVPFNSIIDRLYRIVRQIAKELDKRVNFDLRDAQIELDRSVLEKMVGPLEHLLRNAIAHGIESREARRAAGKSEIGEITLALTQQSNEIVIELSDDGAGLDFARIRAKAIEQGLLGADQEADERRLTQFIFMPGFSTASELSELSGRGVGMDVVKSETAILGGRIEVNSQPGLGTRFRIYLPLTLAVTQALLIRSGHRTYALPSTMVEQVMELKSDPAAKIRSEGSVTWLGAQYPWHYLERMLGNDPSIQPPQAKRYWMLLLKGGERQIALEVDGLIGNQEIVVKNIGPQLARVPGISGATVLNNGEIALILNPIVLTSRELGPTQLPPAASPAAPISEVPLIMVVDDSLTVRKIVGRLLTREGYQVATAKDGVDAVEQLQDIVPAVMLVDIEMPRMDGFDLTRNVRADARLKDVPIIMITSRIAEKHRNYAESIGVNEYLGKPYDEEELLRQIAGFVTKQGMQVPSKA